MKTFLKFLALQASKLSVVATHCGNEKGEVLKVISNRCRIFVNDKEQNREKNKVKVHLLASFLSFQQPHGCSVVMERFCCH